MVRAMTQAQFKSQLATLDNEALRDVALAYLDGGEYTLARIALCALADRLNPPVPTKTKAAAARELTAARRAELTRIVDRHVRGWRNHCARIGRKLPPLYVIRSLQDAGDALLDHHVRNLQEALGVTKAHGRQLVSRWRHGRPR